MVIKLQNITYFPYYKKRIIFRDYVFSLTLLLSFYFVCMCNCDYMLLREMIFSIGFHHSVSLIRLVAITIVHICFQFLFGLIDLFFISRFDFLLHFFFATAFTAHFYMLYLCLVSTAYRKFLHICISIKMQMQ